MKIQRKTSADHIPPAAACPWIDEQERVLAWKVRLSGEDDRHKKTTNNPGDEGHLPCVFQPLSQEEVHSSAKLKNSPHIFKTFIFTHRNVGVKSCPHLYAFGGRHKGRALKEHWKSLHFSACSSFCRHLPACICAPCMNEGICSKSSTVSSTCSSKTYSHSDYSAHSYHLPSYFFFPLPSFLLAHIPLVAFKLTGKPPPPQKQTPSLPSPRWLHKSFSLHQLQFVCWCFHVGCETLPCLLLFKVLALRKKKKKGVSSAAS